MTIRPNLLHWQLRKLRAVSAVAIPVAALWALLTPMPLYREIFTPMFFALVHGIAIAVSLGRFRSPEFAFLHSRRFSRAALWGHTWLASGFAVMVVWLPAALIVWSGARSALLDHFRNPNYPIIAPLDTSIPWWWLWWYALLLPVLHYTWIRYLQPTKGANDGLWLTIGYIMAMLMLCGVAYLSSSSQQTIFWLVIISFPAVSLALLFAGRKLFDMIEVRR